MTKHGPSNDDDFLSLQAQNKDLRQALKNICRHQEYISGNGELIGGTELYKLTGAWQIANRAIASIARPARQKD